MVSLMVAPGIIDSFKVVHIEEYEGQLLASLLCYSQYAFKCYTVSCFGRQVEIERCFLDGKIVQQQCRCNGTGDIGVLEIKKLENSCNDGQAIGQGNQELAWEYHRMPHPGELDKNEDVAGVRNAGRNIEKWSPEILVGGIYRENPAVLYGENVECSVQGLGGIEKSFYCLSVLTTPKIPEDDE